MLVTLRLPYTVVTVELHEDYSYTLWGALVLWQWANGHWHSIINGICERFTRGLTRHSVCVCVCVCVYLCTYVRICVRVCVCVLVRVSVYVCYK